MSAYFTYFQLDLRRLRNALYNANSMENKVGIVETEVY